MWLTACKTARWLGLPAPAWSDTAAMVALLEKHRAAYLTLRAGSGECRGEHAVSEDAGYRPTGTRHSADGSADAPWRLVTVARAGRSELVALTAPARPTGFRDDLEDWTLVAIRGLRRKRGARRFQPFSTSLRLSGAA